ncbi:MAG: phosphate ABC transporter permease PstA [Solirubrobacterales bacterium]
MAAPPPPPSDAAAVTLPGTGFQRDRDTQMREVGFAALLLAALGISLITLLVLILDIVIEGAGSLSGEFISETPSRIDPSSSGILPAIYGTLYLMLVCAAFIIPVGVASAIYLEEYADRSKWYNRLIELNIQNLAAVPSIVYGVLGLAFLVRGPISLGSVVVAGGLTLGLLVLPVVIVAGREAIRAVPPSIREGSMALGATKWQTIWKQVLPASIPGIATGTILALSRAIGETAPLIVVGAIAFATTASTSFFDGKFSALPIQIFGWTADSNDEFKPLAAAAIIVLMAILLAMNAVAIWLRNRYEQKW